MLDANDLQAIAQLLAQQKVEIKQELMEEMRGEMDVRFAQQKKEIMHEVNLLMEGYFDPKFNHLADGLELLRQKLAEQGKIEGATDRLDVLETVVKIHSRDIEKLKKANNIA